MTSHFPCTSRTEADRIMDDDYRVCGAAHPAERGWHCDLPYEHLGTHFAAFDGYLAWEPETADARICRFCRAIEGVTSHAGGCQPDEDPKTDEIKERVAVTLDIDAEMSAYHKGAQDALDNLAESFDRCHMTEAAQITRRALAFVTETSATRAR